MVWLGALWLLTAIILREQLEEQDRRKRVIEGEQVTLERACNETMEKIRNNKAQIEKNVFDFLNKRITIE